MALEHCEAPEYLQAPARSQKLPERLKQKVEGLRGVHFPSSTWPGPHALNRSKQAKPGEKEIDLVSEHPIVTVHPGALPQPVARGLCKQTG